MSLKIIAERVGVSISTVSRVLNQTNAKAASPSLQKQIWDVAHEIGYTPNNIARQLRTSTTTNAPERNSVYCMIARSVEESKEDPFYTKILSGIDYAAFKNGYVVEYTFQLRDIENGTMDHVMQNTERQSLITIGRLDQALIERLKRYFKRFICISLNSLDLQVDQVICDGYFATQKAIHYLHTLGHRNIGFIGEENESRYRGYSQAMRELDLPIDERNVICDAMISMEGGNTAMETIHLRGGHPTAIFCSNDRAAIGALRACKEHGLRVPEDISIIGMNDIETTQYVSPMLSTIHVPLEELGRVAVNVLLDRIHGGHSLPLNVALPYYIVKRESCTNALTPAQQPGQ